MVSLSSRISPRTSTVIFLDKSPLATAVVTSAMLRTCAVRFDAIEFTESVRSFHVPATPLTCAWPPSFPSVPTSRATRVASDANEFSTEGKLGGQAQVKGVAGTWKDLTDNVNSMASNLTNQVRNIAEVTTAVARGDLSRKITVRVKGELLQLKQTINTTVDQLNAFGSEVTRVAREVGTEG